MKKVYKSAIIILCFYPSIHSNPSRSITLENNALHIVDGKNIGINGETIAQIKKYQSNIIDILIGHKTTQGRVGSYEFEGKKYSAQELRKIEDELGATRSTQQSDELQKQLNKMRDDFEKISEEFKDTAKAAKPIMAILIEESCKKRNRGDDALILIWAKSKEDEVVLFNRHVKTIKDFETFMTDLYNFLGDLIHSCPKAQAQFKERVEKFTKIKQLLATLKLSTDDEQRFLRFVHVKLNDLSLPQINSSTVQQLYSSFKK